MLGVRNVNSKVIGRMSAIKTMCTNRGQREHSSCWIRSIVQSLWKQGKFCLKISLLRLSLLKHPEKGAGIKATPAHLILTAQHHQTLDLQIQTAALARMAAHPQVAPLPQAQNRAAAQAQAAQMPAQAVTARRTNLVVALTSACQNTQKRTLATMACRTHTGSITPGMSEGPIEEYKMPLGELQINMMKQHIGVTADVLTMRDTGRLKDAVRIDMLDLNWKDRTLAGVLLAKSVCLMPIQLQDRSLNCVQQKSAGTSPLGIGGMAATSLLMAHMHTMKKGRTKLALVSNTGQPQEALIILALVVVLGAQLQVDGHKS